MAKTFRTDDFKTPICRLSYAQSLFKARKVDDDSKEKFGCTLIFDKTELHFFEKLCRDVIVGEWHEKGLERAKAGLIKSPLLAGDGKEARNKTTGEISPGLGADKFFIRPSANADKPPSVWWKDPNKQEKEDVVYSGCYGKAILHMYAWHHPKSGDMICIGIAGFQKLREGERLGSGPPDTTKYHETVEDLGDAPSETKDGAGASGLFG